jgi:hypothetical protein
VNIDVDLNLNVNTTVDVDVVERRVGEIRLPRVAAARTTVLWSGSTFERGVYVEVHGGVQVYVQVNDHVNVIT